VIGEGGNLGFTQLGRIEFAFKDGKVLTDAIDNSGGVNCSDHEVNIKILLNQVVINGDMTLKQRNQLLAEMTDEVAELVLRQNYLQPQAISIAMAQATELLSDHIQVMRSLERAGKLDRRLEFLPGDEELAERQAEHRGLVPPEMAVVLAYSKISLFEELIGSNVPEDPYLKKDLLNYFPRPLRERYAGEMEKHRLPALRGNRADLAGHLPGLYGGPGDVRGPSAVECHRGTG
jgi:glutamate dehydrogenase